MIDNFFILFSSIQHQFLTKPLDYITVAVLIWTAIATARAAKASAESNDLRLMPFLGVYFKGAFDNKKFYLKNIGESLAYDIKVEPWKLMLTDVHVVWELKGSLKGINVLSKGEEVEVDVKAYENGKLTNKELLMFTISPELDEEIDHKIKTRAHLYITFRDGRSHQYYMLVLSGRDGTWVVIPPRKITWRTRIILFYHLTVRDFLLSNWYKFLWRLNKPHIG